MGSTDSIPETNCSKLNNNNWSTLTSQDLQQQPIQYGRYVRLKNKMTGEQINEYQLVFSDQEDYAQFLHVLNFRNSAEQLVHIHYFNEEKIHHLCSLLVNIKVYIDHFPLRISDVYKIPYPDYLYVLARSLSGFSILYNQFGHFHITQDLICINQEGIIKIWLNPNLSKSKAQTPTGSSYHKNATKHVCSYEIQQKSTENSMIWQLLTMIDRLANKQSLPNGGSFLDYLKKVNKSQLNFNLAQQLLLSYAQQNSSEIPEEFQSALKIIREKKGIFDSQVGLTLPKVNVQEIDLTNLGSRFKQSKVERVQSVKYPSAKSQIASESNHTFADKLKSFDQARAKIEAFGKSLTPIKQNIVALPQKNEPLTERVLGNSLSFSCLSSPQFQSLTAIGQQQRVGAFPTSSSNSEIISNQKSKNPLTLSQSPKQKPATYFSQYINSAEQQVKMVKKTTIFSFGEGIQQHQISSTEPKQKDNLLTNVPVTLSLQNSKNQARASNKPIITFTYNSVPPNNPKQPTPPIISIPLSTNTLLRSQSTDQVDMPISPPSVDKKSSMFLQQAKQIQQGQKHNQSIKQENMIENMMRIENKKIFESLYTKLAEDREQYLDNIKQQGIMGGREEGFDFGIKIEQSRDKPQFQSLQESKQPLSPTIGQQNSPQILQPMKQTEQQVIKQSQKQIVPIQVLNTSNPQSSIQEIQEQSITNILLNQFEIDPDIVSDLIYYEQRKIKKKKKKTYSNL